MLMYTKGDQGFQSINSDFFSTVLGPPHFPNKLSSPYNDDNLSGAPRIPANTDQQEPVHSYGDSTPSVPPTTAHNGSAYQGYPQPTRPKAEPTAQDYPSLYPAPQQQQYPNPTRPRDGYNQLDENSRLLN